MGETKTAGKLRLPRLFRRSAKDKDQATPAAKPAAVKAPRKKGLRVKLIVLGVVVLILLAAAGFCALSVTTDVFGTRSWFIDRVVRLDPDHEAHALDAQAAELSERADQLKLRERQLSDLEAQLGLAEEALDAQKTALDKRAAALDGRSAGLDAREAAIKEREQVRNVIFRAPMSDADLADMKALAKTYAAMDADKASAILLRMENVEDAAAILYFMAEKKSSAILAAMDADDAAKLTAELLLASY